VDQQRDSRGAPVLGRLRSVAAVCIGVAIALLVSCPSATPAGRAETISLSSAAPAIRASLVAEPQSFVVPYTAWNGAARESVLLLPADYDPSDTDRLPCLLVAHPRGSTAYDTAAIWRDLPTRLRFAVLCAGSAGRKVAVDSWAFSGQLQDLMALPDRVTAALPWVRLDRTRLYAAGVSMGGTEALCLLAMFPDRLAAAASFDGVADLAAYYHGVPRARRARYQALLRREVGGTPKQASFRYAVRSPLTFARTFATAGVPVGIWWSRTDKSVPRQQKVQSGKLCRAIRSVWPQAQLKEVKTSYGHGHVLQHDPMRLLKFLRPGGQWRTLRTAPPSRWQYAGWLPSVGVWGYRFSTQDGLTRLWRAKVSRHKIEISTPATLQVDLPYTDRGRPASVVLNGQSALVWPRRGALSLVFPPGSSTALIDP